MSKLMLIIGILFAAVGVAIGLMIFFSPGSVVGWGFTPEVAVTLLVGGALSAGLGGVIQAVEAASIAAPRAVAVEVAAEQRPATVVPAEEPAYAPLRRTPAAVPEALSPAVQETITALEDAKTSIRQALEEPVAAPEPQPVAVAAAEEAASQPVVEPVPAEIEEPAIAEEEEPTPAEEGQLYVIEERLIRNREARVLSDGTVEAETDEGWMRFENLEHLDEYLDATEPAPRA